MGEQEQMQDYGQIIEVEYKISMYCNACEKSIARVISKIKGVEKFVTDMIRHRVIVTGRFCPNKVLKKLKKKTGKKVSIIEREEEKDDEWEEESNEGQHNNFEETLDRSVTVSNDFSILYHEWCGSNNPFFTIFSDENAHSCSIM
ncbi:hypothetical protein RND81_03G112600 [Saponaria officinalis]|uniref:HMA domain-containing protein n=1 Tax=Saponaria officinalis TaxID=3572 RepID=A0AAW1M9S8_SAPOF